MEGRTEDVAVLPTPMESREEAAAVVVGALRDRRNTRQRGGSTRVWVLVFDSLRSQGEA